MLTYILRRILLMFPTLLGITMVVFFVMAASPGGITSQSLIEGQNLEPEAKKALADYYNRIYGLDDPAPVQYLRWLNNISPVGFTFDKNNDIDGFSLWKGFNLGKSFRYGRPVLDLIAEHLPITLLLNFISLPIIYLIAIGIGVRAAVKRGEAFDIGSGVTMLGLWSVPTMLAGVLMIGFLASDQYWHWFPTAGLNYREALDMPFLPHWQNFRDLISLFLFSLIGLFSFILLARWKNESYRVALFSIVGATLGFFMAESLPGITSWPTYTFLMFVLIGIVGSVAYSEYLAMRLSFLGLLGIFVGVLVSTTLFDGEFTRGFLLDRIWHLFLPVICLSYGSFAFLSKLTRTAILENLLADFARTARAKGVAEKDVLWRHVFRNSLLPLITVSASLLPGLLAGSVIVESIFSIDGMGKLVIEAVKGRDRELVLSITFISGLLTLVGYLIADICYAAADPRVSYD